MKNMTTRRAILLTALVIAACELARITVHAQPGPVVNVNTATEAQIAYLPGIGAKTAEAIVAYRTENREFTTLTDLQNVRGIGPKKYDTIRPYVTLTGETTAKGKIRVPKTPKPAPSSLPRDGRRCPQGARC